MQKKMRHLKTEHVAKTSNTGRPFYFICVFWGQRYWKEFANLCLASLLSPSNLGSLSSAQRETSKFLIVTTQKDWQELQKSENFKRLNNIIRSQFVELDIPKDKNSKMSIMSHGHKLASNIAFKKKALGVFLTPDLILADGAVKSLSLLANRGKVAVLCLAVRFSEEGCLKDLKNGGFLTEDKPLSITPRELVRIASANIHSETKRYDWLGYCFAEQPISPFWRVGSTGFIFYSFSWAPLLVDYGAINAHDDSTFDNWTLDGDYIDKNFGRQAKDKIYVVRDSDEITLVSFTREAELHFDTNPYFWCMIPKISTKVKQIFLRDLFLSPIMDDLKRQIFNYPVLFHSRDITDQWHAKKQKAQRQIDEATILPPSIFEKWVRWTFFSIIKLWQLRKGYWIMIKGNADAPNAPFQWQRFWLNFVLPYSRLLLRAPFINGMLYLNYRATVIRNKLVCLLKQKQ